MRRSSIWLLFNLVGVAAYIWLASRIWVPPGEEGTPGGPGDAFYVFLCLYPVLGLFAGLNLAALVLSVRRAGDGGTKKVLIVGIAVASLWGSAIALDKYKSYNVIDAAYV